MAFVAMDILVEDGEERSTVSEQVKKIMSKVRQLHHSSYGTESGNAQPLK